MAEHEGLNHLEIAREAMVKEYRFHSNPNAPRPPFRDRAIHGEKLRGEFASTTESLRKQRTKMGIEADNLLVMSITNQALNQELLERMLRAFKLALVEEVPIDNTELTRILVQFPDKSSLLLFNNERELWTTDSREDAILTYAQRRDLFACLETIRPVQREDRMGPQLRRMMDRKEPLPDGLFYMNIDIWHNGDRSQIVFIEKRIQTVLGTQGSILIGDLFETPSLLLGRARVNEFSLNALLDFDWIATVDFPIGSNAEGTIEFPSPEILPIIKNDLESTAPLAAILDSGVFSGHPLLKDVIVAEEDFDQTEQTTSDLCGHGTGVAGIVVFGDMYTSAASGVFTARVRICNAKIMHNDGSGYPIFCSNKRHEQVVKEAIEYFNREYGCRVFNLSSGNPNLIYDLGRQMAWAEVLDQLSRELDVVIVVSAGNVSNPIINDFTSREEFMCKCRDQLFDPEFRLIDPASASLCVTVGAIARFDEPEHVSNRSIRIAACPAHAPSVFTRIGPGVKKAIKPEFVDFGGNYAVHQPIRGSSRWVTEDRKLSEYSLNNNLSKPFKGFCGTSFAAPHVTHVVARIEHALSMQLGEKPSANLIRAMLANSATQTDTMIDWTEKSFDKHYHGKEKRKQERRLRLIGYGKVSLQGLSSGRNHVTLFSQDELNLRTFHLYKIPVPIEFIRLKCNKQISISLAYNPASRLSRKDYLANHLWFEVYRKIDETALAQYKAKKEKDQDEGLDALPDEYKAEFKPGHTEIASSTLQQRIWRKRKNGGKDLNWNENDPYIFVLVAGKERFKHAEQELPQPYAVVVSFSYENEQEIELYNKLRQSVRLRDRQKARVRAQVKR